MHGCTRKGPGRNWATRARQRAGEAREARTNDPARVCEGAAGLSTACTADASVRPRPRAGQVVRKWVLEGGRSLMTTLKERVG